MRTTLNLDDALLEHAHRLTGIPERTALITCHVIDRPAP